MSEIITTNTQLPSTLEDLSKFILIARDKLKHVLAEVDAIKHAQLAKDVMEQKLKEAQDIALVSLKAEAKFGALTSALPKASGGDRKSENFKSTSGGNFDRVNSKEKQHTSQKSETKTQTTKKEELEKLGVSKNNASRYEKMAAHPEAIEQAQTEAKEAGTVATRERVLQIINENKNKANREARKEKIAEQISKPKTSNHVDIFTTENKYRVIYADPPWSYGDKQNIDGLGGAEKHYPTMPLEDICKLPIPAEDNAVLFLWVTSPMLEDSFKVINAWGFKYKSSFVWDKVKHNMGHYNSVRHELLLICTRGNCLPDEQKLFDSVVTIERTEHSRKPDVFRNMIDTLYPLGQRLEMFAREASDGWDVWGNMA